MNFYFLQLKMKFFNFFFVLIFLLQNENSQGMEYPKAIEKNVFEILPPKISF